MRYLHSVGLHEKFIASGIYVESDTQTEEAWAIHALPDGARMIRTDREADGRVWLTEAWQAPQNEGGEIERIDVYTYGKGMTPIRATLMREGDSLIITERHGREEATEKSCPLEVPTLLIPTGYVFMGALIVRANRATVRYTANDRIEAQFVSARDVWQIEDAAAALEGHAATIYRAGNWRAWLDPYQIVLQLADDSDQSVRLKDYARSK